MAGTRNERSERILHAAMHLFYERGFDGVGVDLIGERAGMSGPAIYRYFTGKDEILVTLIDEAIDRVQESTDGRHSDPTSELDHLIRGHVQRAIQERELMSVWTRGRNSIPKEYRPRLRARINRYVNRWADCLDACYPGHPRDVLVAATHAAHGMIDSTAAWPQQSLKLDGLQEMLVELAHATLKWLDADREGPPGSTERSI